MNAFQSQAWTALIFTGKKMEWFDKTEGFTERDKQFLLLAYRNTLCKLEEGQQVLCHLKTFLESYGETDTERMVARKLLDAILNNCGIVGNMKIIRALSDVAASFNVPEREETDNLNV